MPEDNQGTYDVIVIGAGIGGLTCGALLAKNGFKTLVLEQHTVPGGYCTSFKRKGFTFDAAVHFVEGVGEDGSLYQILRELGVEREIEFHHLDPIYRIVYLDEAISIPASLDEYVALLSDKFPEEKEGISEFFDTIVKLAKEMERLPTSFKPWDLALFPLRFPLIYKYYKKTFAQMMADFIRDGKLKSIVSAGSPCLGLPPTKLSALQMCGFLHAAHFEGFYCPGGGAQAFADLLAKALTEHGGGLQLKTKATMILVENNRVAGVETASGNRIEARYVVSNIDARETFFNLIGREKLKRGFLERLDRMEPSISFFQVWLGIDVDPRTKGLSELENLCYSSYDIDYFHSEEEITEGYGICIPSLVQPGLAPEGKHVMSILCTLPYDYRGMWRTEDGKKGEEYRTLKDEVKERLIKAAEGILPGLSEHILVSEVATPLTLERYTSNYRGAAYGWAQSPDQVGNNRLQPKTPIKGLYLAGHWTTPGGGILPVALSGKAAAEAIIRKKV